MRRHLLIFTSLFISVGCTAHHQSLPQTTSAPVLQNIQANQTTFDDARVASALLFDPPVIANQAMPDLARDERELTAFVGYDQSITTFFFIGTNDRQIIDANGAERQAITATFGVRTR